MLYIGSYSYSLSNGAYEKSCTSSVATTHVYFLSISMKRSSFQNSMALSSECCLLISNATDLTQFELSEAGFRSEGANVSLLAFTFPFIAYKRAMPHRCGESRFAGLRRRNQRHIWAFCLVEYGIWKFIRIMRQRHLRQMWSSC